MTRRLITTPSPNAVGAGQTATLNLAVGDLVYHGLRLIYDTSTTGGPTQANMEAEINEIRIKVDGKTQRVFSAAELFLLYQQYGMSVDDGQIPIWFSEFWRRTVQGEDGLAWGTADVATLQVEVDIDSGASSPTLSARALVEENSRPIGPIVKWKKFSNFNPGSTGTFNVVDLPKSDDYFAFHVLETTDEDIGKAVVKIDQEDVFDAGRATAETLYKDVGLTPQATLFSIFPLPWERVGDTFRMRKPRGNGNGTRQVADLRLDLTVDNAQTFDILTETVGPPD
jgi:hypothetical protein